MPKYLVVIEAPGKLEKFRKYLGSDYLVVASKGHIADLPAKGLNVDIKKDFAPTYEVYDDKKDIVSDIVDKAKKVDFVYLMTDPDREGHAIAWHVSRQLPKGTKFKRAVAHSITKDAILKGIAEATDIDLDMVYSYEARRILDRLVGYKTSFLTQQATGGKSAGRTQSAGLRILAEREKEIKSFVPVVYWPVSAELLTKNNEKILADIKVPKALDISTQEEAEKICNTLRTKPVLVSKFEKKVVTQKAYAPFTTSTLYQTAGSLFGWKSDKTASVAQHLYEKGSITYHRTDSVFIIPEFITDTRSLIKNSYGDKYLPKSANSYSNSNKNAQEAHEACRVTDLSLTSYTSGDNDAKRLYEAIWKRTVASQMEVMEVLRISAEFSCEGYVLGANGAKLIFDGWRKVWDYGDVGEAKLPEMVVGDPVKVIDVSTERKETQPPSRYNERSFIKGLEDAGIGRPSTYASIPKTLEARKYIDNDKNITVTDLGLRVNDFLVQTGFCFVDIGFTKGLEDRLDNIANKQENKVDVLSEFWKRLQDDIKNSKQVKQSNLSTGHLCPKCKTGHLVIRHGKFGSFMSCENFFDKDNKCEYKANIGKDGEPVEKVVVEKKYSDIPCPKCKARLVIRAGKKGDFLGCEKYPKCQGLYNTDGTSIEFAKSDGKKKKWRKKK